MTMAKTDTTALTANPFVAEESVHPAARFVVKLRLSISTLFLCLILPAFALCVFYIYNTNYKIYKQNATTLITNQNDQMADKLFALLDPLGDSLLTMSRQVRDDPRLFDDARLHDMMLLHLENNPNLVSIFLASGKGSFRQVQRMRPGMIIANRVPPADAAFNFWVVDRKGAGATSTFTFFKSRDTAPIDTFVVSNNYDPRERPFYKSLTASFAKTTGAQRERYLLLGEPYVAESTTRATMTLSRPVYTDSALLGMVGESFELSSISSFLKSLQISPNSESYVIDADGNIFVSTAADSGYTIVDKNKLIKQNVKDASGKPVQQAFNTRTSSQTRQFEFTDPATSEVYLAQFTAFPNSFNKQWELVTLAPVSDFMVGLNDINRKLMLYGGLVCLLLVLLTYMLSRTISRPIEVLTDDIRGLLDFNRPRHVVHSKIVEINILGKAVNNLRNTLKAFTSYVPRDLVNDLLRSGNEIEQGGESRYMTVLFTDLQGFSSISEVTPSRELVRLVSSYLALVTYAVKEESGTVDKFIGDAVMAFWGAPLLDQNHAYHACVAAVKSQRRMVDFNRRFMEEGLPPLTVRIGIHSDAVLVGNFGSAERMSYTVMGDGVNVAARLEGINKEFATAICISHATYKEAGERLWTRPIDVTTVKGRKGEIPIYELVAIRSEDPEIAATEHEQALCAATQQAYNLYTQRKYKEAAAAYQRIIDTWQDGLSTIMRDKCMQHA
jgi:adenylate cyclase